MAPKRDRRESLLTSTTTNGIDYVEVEPDQVHLRVHFLGAVPVSGALAASRPVTITGGEVIRTVPVEPIDAASWSTDADGRQVLALTAAAPGDFSSYTLTLNVAQPASGVPVLDPFFSFATFTFKANCPSTLDCAAPAAAGNPEPAETPPPIDYLAKDFASFRQALSDFSALRYPDWVERSEADLGAVLMEALSAVADDLSYYQDRVAAEATLDTATQAVSILRHARLVDYEPAPATAAATLLRLDVDPHASPVTLAAPLLCTALGPDGQAIPFEVGTGLTDPLGHPATQQSYTLDARWNEWTTQTGGAPPVPLLVPYWWDDSGQTLPAGSTTLWVTGTGLGFSTGQRLVLHTDGPTSAEAPVRELITLAQAPAETVDYLMGNQAVTELVFTPPLVYDHDLTNSHLMGNIVDAVQGLIVEESFVIPADTSAAPLPTSPVPAQAPVFAVARVGHDGIADYRHTLTDTATNAGNLAWQPYTDTDGSGGRVPVLGDAVVPARPEIVLTEAGGVSWSWRRSLLDVVGPEQDAAVFALTPERYSPVAVIRTTAPDGSVATKTCFDYDGDGATTIRFGDGTFGLVPVPGTVFTARYRVGVGTAGNVPADAVTTVVPDGGPATAAVLACTNPFPATGGADAETAQQVRDRAPQQFRARQFRVVRPEDYVQAAQSLPWVEQAGTTFRWTGSWLAAFTTADPSGAEEPTADQVAELTDLLDRERLAGYASYVLGPRYASLDLRVTVRAAADRFRGDVEAAVLDRLLPGTRPDGSVGFFDHSRWRFGMPLESSAFAAAVQEVPGVVGVTTVTYRQRGTHPDYGPLPDTLLVAPDQILRLDGDPSRPEAGSLAVTVEGGK